MRGRSVKPARDGAVQRAQGRFGATAWCLFRALARTVRDSLSLEEALDG
jgi:hypothetical protein